MRGEFAIMTWFHGLHFNNLRGDIYGGLTAAVVALPLALAMGVSSGAGPIAGIYGAIFVGLFAALFGGTPSQVSGPTGPMTVVMAAVFTQYTAMFPDDPGKGAAIAFTVVILGGLLQILFGLLKLGKYINLIPHPVVSGFMSGIGVIIILLQLGPLVGHEAQPGPIPSAVAFPEALQNLVPEALALGLFAMAVVYFMPPRINRILPSPLVALIAGTLALFLLHGGQMTEVMENGKTVYRMGEATVLGAIPTGLPSPSWPVLDISLLGDMLESALILAVLGSIDSLLTSLVADNMTRSHHESDRELIGQGIGNTLAGVFGGLPGAGATMRTVVNVRSGGRTPLSGTLHAIVLLGVVAGAGVVAQYIPHAVLAGILVKVGTDIIDWDYLKRAKDAPKAGVIIMLTVFFMTLFVNLIVAVGVGMVMASFLFMQRMVELQLNSISTTKEAAGEAPLSEEEKGIMREANGRILLYHIAGPLSFGAAKGMVRRLTQQDDYDVLVLDLSDVPQVDFTSTKALDDMLTDAQESGREAFLVSCRPSVTAMLEKQGVLSRVPSSHRGDSRVQALKLALAVVNKS